MAKANSKISVLLMTFALMLPLLTVSLAAADRLFGSFGFVQANATPQCDSVYGVRSGDTCSGITQKFNLSTAFFGSINPNLNCDSLFVGQWLCVDGSPN